MKFCEKVNTAAGRALGIPNGKGALGLGGAMLLLIVVAWVVVLLMPYGWHQQDSIEWSFWVSLYSFGTSRNEAAVKTQQHHAVTKLSQLFDSLDSRDTVWLSVAKWEFCRAGVSPAWCEYFERLQIASWMLLSLGLLGICCVLMGVMTCFVFHYIKPRGELFLWGTMYLVTAPVVFQVGTWQYYLQTQGFGHLIGESGSTFGWCWITAIVLASLTWIPAWIIIGFAFRYVPEDTDDEEKLWGTDSEGDYGAIGMDMVHSAFRESMAQVPYFAGDAEASGDTATEAEGIPSETASPMSSPGLPSETASPVKFQPGPTFGDADVDAGLPSETASPVKFQPGPTFGDADVDGDSF